MALGSELEAARPAMILKAIANKIGGKSFKDLADQEYLFMGDGDPTSDNSTGNPAKLGVIYYDYTGDSIWVCTTWASSSSHTWTEVWA